MTKTTFLLLCISSCLFSCQSSAPSEEEEEPPSANIIAPGAKLVQVAADYKFTEGPAVDPAGNVYFTDQPNDRIIKWSTNGELSVFMEACGRSNGMYFDNEGKLLTCADENNQLWRIDPQTKEVEVLLENFEGKLLNGPNDLWVDAKGGIYFTDPFYKRPYWDREEKEIEQERVYYLSPEGDPRVVSDEFVKPNGIVGTPDGRHLFVADIGDNKTYRFDIDNDASLSNRTLFCEMGSDGMTLDTEGNLYITGKGVTVFNKNGEQIEQIPIEENWTANVVFGGKDQKTLFITAMKSLYTLDMSVAGVR